MPHSRSGLSRRRFLASTATAAAATAGGVPLLTACTSGDGGSEGRVSLSELDQMLPSFQESRVAVQPDIPSVNGSVPGYTTFIPSAELGVSVPKPRGNGGEFTMMSPLWGSPPRSGNAYWTAMDEAIGVRMHWQTQDGSTYGAKLEAVLAGSEIPDMVCIPGWELHGQIPRAVSSRFADLGPYLSGNRVLAYENLAAVPTDAWQASIFGGALRGLPMPSPPIGGVIPYYRQDIFETNGWQPPTSPEEFLAFSKDVTSPRNRVWACEDMKWSAFIIFGALPERPQYWQSVGGRLVNRYETDAYLEALEWTRKLFDAGVVHPDSEAVLGDPTQRFTAGESLMFNQGDGTWYGTMAEQRDTNPDFRINAFDYFGAGGEPPVLYKANGSGIWTFLNKDLPEDRLREALEIANFCAAPYGTVENRLRTMGVEGVHYTVENGLPVRTQQGGQEVTADTYLFICSPRKVIAHPDAPQLVEDWTGWIERHMPYVRESLFYGRQIQEPDRFANLSDQFNAFEDDVVRGRQSLRNLQNAVAEWRRNGGNELRDWYQKLLDNQST